MTRVLSEEALADVRRSSSSLWSYCSPDVQNRVNALLNYQAEYFRLRVEFHRRLQDLQHAYGPEFDRILNRRCGIVDGSCEPTALEKQVNWSTGSPVGGVPESDSIQSIARKLQQVSTDSTSDLGRVSLSTQSLIVDRGVPRFWLTVLKNLDAFEFGIQPRDELCLEHLLDIRCALSSPQSQSVNFTLEFHFAPTNPFFPEPILIKIYSIRIELDDSNPYRCYEGPEVDRCQGCSITWTPEHNLTVRQRNKRMRHKTTSRIRTVQVEETIKSFFDFFSPPIVPPGGIDEMNDEEQMRLEADIEFGLLLKQRVLPRAILYYTGEALPMFVDDEEDEMTSSDRSR